MSVYQCCCVYEKSCIKAFVADKLPQVMSLEAAYKFENEQKV